MTHLTSPYRGHRHLCDIACLLSSRRDPRCEEVSFRG